MQSFMLNHGETTQVYLFFSLLLVLLIVERLWPKRERSAMAGKRYFTNFALTTLAIVLLPILPLSFITAAYWAEAQQLGLLNMMTLPVSLLIVGTLLLRGLISYATHFLNHKVPMLWRIHRVHHLDTQLDVSSTVRFHPLEMPVSMLIGLPMVVGLGLSPWVLILYELFDVAVTLFSHSNLKIPRKLDRLLRYLIVTPNLHTVHHSTVLEETDSNFSAVFPLWDIVFGTFRVKEEEDIASMDLGLEVRGPKAHNLGWLLASPFLSQEKYQANAEASA